MNGITAEECLRIGRHLATRFQDHSGLNDADDIAMVAAAAAVAAVSEWKPGAGRELGSWCYTVAKWAVLAVVKPSESEVHLDGFVEEPVLDRIPEAPHGEEDFYEAMLGVVDSYLLDSQRTAFEKLERANFHAEVVEPDNTPARNRLQHRMYEIRRDLSALLTPRHLKELARDRMKHGPRPANSPGTAARSTAQRAVRVSAFGGDPTQAERIRALRQGKKRHAS